MIPVSRLRGLPQMQLSPSFPAELSGSPAPSASDGRMGRSYEVGVYRYTQMTQWRYGKNDLDYKKYILKIIIMVILIYFDDTPYIWIYIYILDICGYTENYDDPI